MNSNSDLQRYLRPVAMVSVLLALSLLAGSCMTAHRAAQKEKKTGLDRGYRFSHALHEQQGLNDCTVCHDPAAGNPSALSTPGHDLCSVCHEIPESGTVAPADPVEQEKCNFCHTREDYTVSPWKKVLSDELKWQHAPHLTAELACAECHTELDTRAMATTPMKPVCMDCHAKQSSKPELNTCATCHAEVNMDTIPKFRNGQRVAHDATEIWTKVHGNEARVDAAYCAMCHETQNRCDDCHSVTAPDNHTLLFKDRTHGLIATWDRNSCATCHEESTCMQCHSEKQPISHRAGWGGQRNSHCVNCHFPAERSGCTECHETVEHAGATRSPHALGVFPPNCARCHPGGLPNQAPHLLNSTVHCAVCHQ
jgi:predicted CXXCH cytochrome family protein